MLKLNQPLIFVSFSWSQLLGHSIFSYIIDQEQIVSIVHQMELLDLLNFLQLLICRIGMPNPQPSSMLFYLQTILQLQLSTSIVPIVEQYQKLNQLSFQKRMYAHYSIQNQQQIMILQLRLLFASILGLRYLQNQTSWQQYYEALEESQIFPQLPQPYNSMELQE